MWKVFFSIILASALCCVSSFELTAQNSTMTGVVVDESGEPLAGVAIVVKGSSVTAISSADGKFTINAGNGSTLQFFMLGMKTKEMNATAGQNLSVVLETESAYLDEVVVTGYGSFKKSTYTGSASVVSTEKLKELPVVSITQMMEGNLPGMQIFSSSGQPGSGTSIIVRGRGSINASTEPLYVLDGVPVSGGNLSHNSNSAGGLGLLATINPADIESITVLKDAASASLYGARGANGVVLIRTKSAQAGKTSYNVKVSGGFSDFAMQYRPMMGGQERRELIYEGYVNYQLDNGLSQSDAEAWADQQIDNAAAIPAKGYADWEKAMFHKGWQKNVDFSAMGGNERTSFISSFSYTNQEGVSFDSFMKRISGRFGLENKYNKFDFGFNVLLSLTNNKSTPESDYYSSALFATKYSITPSDPIYLEDGSYNHAFSNNGNYNPIQESEVNDYGTRAARVFGSAHVGYTIIPGLKIQETFNTDISYTKENVFWSKDSGDGKSTNGNGYAAIYESMNWDSNTMLSYIKSFGNHNLDAALAYEAQQKDYDYVYARAVDFGSGINHDLDNASTPRTAAQSSTRETMLSFVGRLNYDYASKYLLSLSFRRDGSSRLAPGHKWDNFWAVSGSWRAIQEGFMAPVRDVLSDLKFRASYGVNGNLPGSLYGFYGTYSTSGSYNNASSLIESTIANPDLSWERNYASNFGIDFGLFNRVNATLDVYSRDTKGLLMSKQVNNISGFGSVTGNIGQLRNRGFELELTSININKDNFYWTTSLNLAHNANKIIALNGEDEINDGRYIRKVGESFGSLYLREYAGVDPMTGEPQYYVNAPLENGTLSRDITKDPNDAYRKIVADIFPYLTGGLQNTLSYKGLSLSFNFTFSLGGHSYDNLMYGIEDDGYNAYINKSIALRDRWRKPGDQTDVPRYVFGQEFGGWWNSSRGVHSTDHIRLKNAILSYSIPQKWMSKAGMNSAKVYVSGTNLWTLAKYKLYDPEIQGVHYLNIPPLRTIAIGIEIGL
ncbi:MAG: TonB-dependent receptor [Bacteroidales bacterium]|nr:TonB-dependent receptor [Bacteroidales bacterium]